MTFLCHLVAIIKCRFEKEARMPEREKKGEKTSNTQADSNRVKVFN